MKTEILNNVLNVVSEVCEISSEEILSKCKREDIVLARCIFVHYCYGLGIPAVSIALFLHRKCKCIITKYLQHYGVYVRQYFDFRDSCDKVWTKLSTIYKLKE